MRRRLAASLLALACASGLAAPAVAQPAPPPGTSAPTTAPVEGTAGPEFATPYVFGGSVAPYGSYPFLTVLLRAVPGGYAVYCGGTLVRPDFVLTAAHCVVGQPPPDLVVVGQASAAPAPGALGDARTVAEILVDPAYAPAGNSHDLALLRLAEPATRRPAHRVRPATSALTAVGSSGVGLGFGSTVPDDGQFVAAVDLQQTTLTVEPDGDCAAAYGASVYLSDRMLCAGAVGSGVCRGDSGGPLVFPDPSRWLAVGGVVSFGALDCDAAPAAFTDLGEAANDVWLTSVLGDRASLWGIERIAGGDRVATAVAISGSAFPAGAGTAFVVTGDTFPDALAVGPVAGMAGAPVLLVTRDAVPAATAAELARLDPDRIVVVGGAGRWATAWWRRWAPSRRSNGSGASPRSAPPPPRPWPPPSCPTPRPHTWPTASPSPTPWPAVWPRPVMARPSCSSSATPCPARPRPTCRRPDRRASSCSAARTWSATR